jgi:thymidine phosphorylase
MLPQEIIRKKRDGLDLKPEEIGFFISGLTRGDVSEAQAAAFAMAIFFRGMSREECASLTLAMAASGTVLDWRKANLSGPVIDKHSSGGVGDAVSLILAPALAACGAFVPKLSGHGLGHTGGTLDKLESIPGYNTKPDIGLFMDVVRSCGCAIIGQTADLAPADKKLYAVRDVTATVESIPLLTSSILSKKIAAGVDALVIDVKTGSGAFLPSLEEARLLARTMVSVATEAHLSAAALITDMDQPLASAAGNAVEIEYAIDYLTGAHRATRLHEVVLALGTEALALGRAAQDRIEARSRMTRAIETGAAAERFARMVAALGGPADLIENKRKYLPRAPVILPVYASREGRVMAIDTRALGIAVVALGGGRHQMQDKIDPSVGLTQLAALGTQVSDDVPLCMVHARSAADAAAAAEAVISAYRVADEMAPDHKSCIIERIGADNAQ